MNKKISGALLAVSLVLSQAVFAADAHKKDGMLQNKKENTAVVNDETMANQAGTTDQTTDQTTKKADTTK